MSRPALLLLPGLLCDHAAWLPLLPRLAERAACTVADYSDLSSLEAMAARVLADTPPRFALAGHSMGGRVAMEVMRKAPDRVERLALLDTGYRPVAEGEAGAAERAGREALLALAREQGMRAMGRRWSERMVHPGRLADVTLMDAVLDMIERQTAARFAGQIRALLARPDATSVLRAVRCPTLVLCGRDDAWAPLAQHREIAALIPDAELAIIEDSGHMSTMERPDAVAEALLRWLAREANGGADTGSRPRQASTGERSDPDSERLVEQPGHLARRFHQIAVSLFCEEFAPHDVTPAQYAILCTLDEQPGVDQVTLAGLLALDTSTSASVCARLEERGLVYRAQSDDDRRKKKLLLTEAGRRVVRATRASAHRLRERLLGPLAPREQREFLRLLERLVDANNALSRAPYQPLAAQAQP